jgi:hypothetical protein
MLCTIWSRATKRKHPDIFPKDLTAVAKIKHQVPRRRKSSKSGVNANKSSCERIESLDPSQVTHIRIYYSSWIFQSLRVVTNLKRFTTTKAAWNQLGWWCRSNWR